MRGARSIVNHGRAVALRRVLMRPVRERRCAMGRMCWILPGRESSREGNLATEAWERKDAVLVLGMLRAVAGAPRGVEET